MLLTMSVCCDTFVYVHTGPPGGALTFGSFTELPSRQLPNAENQAQNGPGMAQQQSGSLSQGPPQQMLQQQQQQAPRRGSGPRNSQGYKGPNNFDSSHAGQPGGMHPNAAAFNFMAGAGPGNYMPQQAYYNAQQAHYYPNNMMMAQGGFQQPAYSAPQPPSRNHQQAPGYPRPQSQPGRPVAMAPTQQSQQSHPSAAAVPPMQKKPSKAIAIIDPDTHTHVLISPRGEKHAQDVVSCSPPASTTVSRKMCLLSLQHASPVLCICKSTEMIEHDCCY